MKKIIMLKILVILFVGMLTGCRGNDDGKQPTGINTKDRNSEIELIEKHSINNKENIKEKVIVDKAGIKITAKSIEYDDIVVEIKVLIENNSLQDITVQARDFSINGIMIDPSMSTDVSSGKKSNSTISIYNSDLEKAKIKTIKDIEFGLVAFNFDSWDDIFEETGIVLQTNAKDYVQKYNTDGYLAVDQNNVKIYVLKLKDVDSFWGADVTVYIENNSNFPITIQARDVSINGFMIDPTFSSKVMPGKKIYDELSFFESDLKDNDIADITEIELKFLVFNSDSWKDIFETKILNIKF